MTREENIKYQAMTRKEIAVQKNSSVGKRMVPKNIELTAGTCRDEFEGERENVALKEANRLGEGENEADADISTLKSRRPEAYLHDQPAPSCSGEITA